MLLPVSAMAAGILLLLWSADRFVEAAAAVAARLGVSQLLIGMVVVGFGTSFPEMMVSALSAWEGASGIALGNAYGSNICNITLILGVTAIVNPTPVNGAAVRREIPVLLAMSVFAALQLWWGYRLTRLDAVLLLAVFAMYMVFIVRADRKATREQLPTAGGTEEVMPGIGNMPFNKAIIWVLVGLGLLMVSSRILVWGAVETALILGISDLAIGLTIVAVGTSLPEFASSLAAARKGNHDIAVGNIIGSNLFNTLVVVGIAGLVRPMRVEPVILSRDIMTMLAVTLALYLVCIPRKGKPPIITRAEGLTLFVMYIAYTMWVFLSSLPRSA